MYSKIISLRFPEKIVTDPIVVNLVRKFDLTFNILKATVYPRKEGFMVMELSGHKTNYQKGIRYLKNLGIMVESIGHDISRDDEVCFQCGACTAGDCMGCRALALSLSGNYLGEDTQCWL